MTTGNYKFISKILQPTDFSLAATDIAFVGQSVDDRGKKTTMLWRNL